MSQATRPISTKKKWPWVAGAAGSVVLLAGAVNAGRSAGQAEVPPAAAVIETTVSIQLATTTVVSTSVVTSAVTQVSTGEPVTITVTAPAVAADAAIVVDAPVPPPPATSEIAPSATSARTSTTTRPDPAQAPSGGSAFYKNCAAVWAAGKAPIHVGEPGYSTDLDGDSDGVGCENPPR